MVTVRARTSACAVSCLRPLGRRLTRSRGISRDCPRPRPRCRSAGSAATVVLAALASAVGVGLSSSPVAAATVVPEVAVTIFVNEDAAPGGDGTSWESAFQDFEDGLEEARAAFGEAEIWVAGGTYRPSRERAPGDPRSASFEPENVLTVYGHFAGFERSPDERDLDDPANQTILSGDLGGPGTGDDAYSVLVLRDDALATVIDGVTVERGRLDSSAPGGDLGGYGAGVQIHDGASVLLRGCTIRDCGASGFDLNAAGAGIWSAGTNVRLEDCTITGNSIGQGRGGGLAVVGTSAVTLERCVLRSNAAVRGGALYQFGGALDVVNSLFVGNAASTGPVFDAAPADVKGSFLHVTATANVCFAADGVASVGNWSGALLFGNVSGFTGAPALGPVATARYSLVEGGFPGPGNRTGQPRFTDPIGPDGIPASGDEDFTLGACSAAIDAGDAEAIPDTLAIDLAGNPRRIDDVATSDTGNGDKPLPDIGAFEAASYVDGDVTQWTGGLVASWNDPGAWSNGVPGPGRIAVFTDDVAAIPDLTGGADASYVLFNDSFLSLDGGGLVNASDRFDVGGCTRLPIDLALSGATISTPLFRIGAFPGWVVRGNGVLTGDAQNLGVLSVDGGSGSGQIEVGGGYTQREVSPLGQLAGRLRLRTDDAATDAVRLQVAGTAALGGSLEFELPEGYLPPFGTTWTVVVAGAIDGTFDVATLPAFSDRFLRVVQTEQLGPGLAEVILETVPVSIFLDFDDPDGEESSPGPGAPSDAVTGYFDDDIFQDVAVTVGGDPGFVYVFLAAGSQGGFDSVVQIAVGRDPVSIGRGRFTFDGPGIGTDDLAVLCSGDDQDEAVWVLRNEGDGAFSVLEIFPIGFEGEIDGPSALAVGDFDPPGFGGGFDDIVVGTRESGIIQAAQNNGEEGFDLGTPLPAGGAVADVDPGCLDNPKDGLLDVAVILTDEEKIRILGNQGGGKGGGIVFQDAVDIPTTGGEVEIAVVDLDGLVDGDDFEDIIAVDRGSDIITIIRNLGDAFGPPTTVPIGTYSEPRSIAVTDADLDGDLDFAVVANAIDGTRTIISYRNDYVDGQLQYAGPMDEFANDDVVIVRAGDVDGDGDDDLVAIASMAQDFPPGEGMDGDGDSDGDGGAGGGDATEGEGGGFLFITEAAELENLRFRSPDINQDGVVDYFDLVLLLSEWGPCFGCPADLNGDGVVETLDLLILLNAWTMGE